MAAFPLPADELLAMLSTILESADAGTQQRLLGILDTLGRQAGCGDAFDEWEADYAWMQQYRAPCLVPVTSLVKLEHRQQPKRWHA